MSSADTTRVPYDSDEQDGENGVFFSSSLTLSSLAYRQQLREKSHPVSSIALQERVHPLEHF